MISRLLVLSGLLLALTVGAVAEMMPPQPCAQPRTISVSASAQRMAAPDVATIVVAVETQKPTVADAVAENNTRSSKVLDALKRLNIAGLTLRTMGFEVQPMYEQPRENMPMYQPARIVAYQVTNRLEARLVNADSTMLADQVGKILGAALGSGANRMDSTGFSLNNDKPVMREALAEATKNAAAMAATMAEASGVKISKLLTLSANPSFQPPMPIYARAMDSAPGGGVPIVAGQLTIEVSVNAVYEIQ